MRDRTTPLDPVEDSLARSLGPPSARTNGSGAQIYVWEIGHCFVAGQPGEDTWFNVMVLPSGKILTERQDHAADGHRTRSISLAHDTPAHAHRWLVAHSEGPTRAAALSAWAEACRRFEPLSGMGSWQSTDAQ
jgi:hypothetical protein